MKKLKGNNRIYYSLGFVYLFLLNSNQFGEQYFDQTVLGLMHNLINPRSLLFTLFFQMIFFLLVFDEAKENFFYKRVIFLIRQQSRKKQFAKCLLDNFITILLMNLLLLLATTLYFRDFSFTVVPFFVMQTLGIYGFTILQTFIEIKTSATISLAILLILFVVLNQLNTSWITYIHTIRFTGNVYQAIGIELVVESILILLTSYFIRKQEILS